MAQIYPYTYFGNQLVETHDATLSVASSAVLYGLSIYTVFHVAVDGGDFLAFRLRDHYDRLVRSRQIIGIDTLAEQWSYESFVEAMTALIERNRPSRNVFVRVSFHIDAQLPGTRSRGLPAVLSAFVYDAEPILPSRGATLGVSSWRRTPDVSIPARAKVNGGYVNAVLARQAAIDQGYDDAILLDERGHVTELSAANLFIVRDNTLITPGHSADILEGINRRTILELAQTHDIATQERPIDRTELYIADEVFATGTSAFLAPIDQIDNRTLPTTRPLTDRLAPLYAQALTSPDSHYLTRLGGR